VTRFVRAGGGSAVSDLGEQGLLDRIAARLDGPPRGEIWAGDDGAVIVAPGAGLVWTTDVLVEGADFDLAWSLGGDIGYKAVAVNASDLAAMGAAPSHALAALSLPASTPLVFVDALLDGMVEAAGALGLALVGGDLSSASEIALCVSMLGAPGPAVPVLRSGALQGDALCVTGRLGGAAGGLAALRAGARPGGDPTSDRLIERQLRPRPRVGEGMALAGAGASAMIDVSDGLLLDLARLMAASGTGCQVDPRAVPVDRDLEAVSRTAHAPPIDPARLAATGGEDFELLFSIEGGALDRARAALEPHGTPMTVIGEVTSGAPRFGQEELSSMEELGWDHLRNP
jgi:thiamine-monophosphate kinase